LFFSDYISERSISLEKFKYYLIVKCSMLLMSGVRSLRFLLIFGSLLSSFILAQGTIPGEICSINCSGSILDLGRAFSQTGSDVCIILNWPLMFATIYNNPPRTPIMPSGNASGTPGANYCYFTSAIDPDGDQVEYTFDWGDGTTSIIGPLDSDTKASANHSWSAAGTYRIRANATDSLGKSSGWSESLIVMLNTPPHNPSLPSGPGLGMPGTLYTYAVSATDPDGDQIEYTFDWGDEATSIIGPLASDKVAEATHTWTRAGTYQVKARAEDSKGATSGWSDLCTVTINTPPKNPSPPSGPVSVYAWTSNSYSTSAADPDDDPVKCTFDWGDGNISTTNFLKSGSNTSALHIWSNEGDYRVRVIATDSRGGTSAWSDYSTITVLANSRPKVPINLFGPSFGYAGIAYSYFTFANDPDNDKVRYTFDWGDETFSKTDSVNAGSVESASHIWSKAGTYRIKCNTTDSKGASSMWSKSLKITIADNDPPDTPNMPSGPTSGRSLTTYDFETSANDPDGDRVRYVLDWGDGITSWTGADFVNSGINESLLHKWSKAGTYLVKAMAMDDKGAISGWSNALAVSIS
jgi:plastocyanin